ncbi:Hypothetical_protein [Hexamita inflata]|uniref:Hypothetical_protein n=1 Tax=Hexamita inflata TaxID=28002 RepID=A0ABP1ISX9_9EUKA
MGFIDAFIHCWHYFCQVRSGNTDKLNIISFQQNQQHKINLSTQLIFDRILTKTVVQLTEISLRQRYCVTKFGFVDCHDLRDEEGMIKLSLSTDDQFTVK